jgi:magnesium-transporting ATPase (P-type)
LSPTVNCRRARSHGPFVAAQKIHQLACDEALRSLQSGPGGLSAVEARRRLPEYGRNEVVRVRREPVLWQFIKEFIHFFALILWLAAGLAFWADWQDPGQGMATLAFAIVGVIVVNGIFSFWQVYRAERALDALEMLLPHHVKGLRDGVYGLEAAAAMAAFFFVLIRGGWRYRQPIGDLLVAAYRQATTACLSAIVVMQVVNVCLCRSDRESTFTMGFWSNRWILFGIAAELLLILAIDYTHWGNVLFGTAPISRGVWLFVLPFAAGMLMLEEMRKWFVRNNCP